MFVQPTCDCYSPPISFLLYLHEILPPIRKEYGTYEVHRCWYRLPRVPADDSPDPELREVYFIHLISDGFVSAASASKNDRGTYRGNIHNLDIRGQPYIETRGKGTPGEVIDWLIEQLEILLGKEFEGQRRCMAAVEEEE